MSTVPSPGKPKRISNEIKAALIGVLGTVLVGVVPLAYMSQANSTAKDALAVQKQQLEIDVRKANDDRDAAKSEADTYRRVIEAAPKTFTDNLEALINQASAETERKEGTSKLLEAAQALVSARRSLASDLETIQSRLDGDIDDLEAELKKESPDQTRVAYLVEVLKRKWPAKKAEIELAVRKIETELGLTERAIK